MSPGLLRRARWYYAGVGLSCGRARSRYCPVPFEEGYACRHPHPRAEVTTTIIRGMSAQIPGPYGGPDG